MKIKNEVLKEERNLERSEEHREQDAKEILQTLAENHMEKPQEKLIDSAVRWWIAKMDKNWSYEKHTKNPTVNCQNSEERELAKAVARFLTQP